MKRYGNIYKGITHINTIKIATNNASKKKKNRTEVQRFYRRYNHNIKEVQKMLEGKTYKTSKYKFKTIVDKGKEREIAILPFYPDRIVHWSLILQVEDIFIKHFIFNTYAAIPNKGVKLALTRLNADIRNNPELKYCLKIDVKKFFPNIDKEVLKQLFRKKFKDKDLLWLLDEIVDSYPKSGIPIGNYTSQYFGNFYLSFFDHWIKEEKKIKVFHRYMDDMVFLGESKEELWKLLDDIREYFDNNLNIKVKENYQVFPVESRGVDFVGFKSYGHKITIRNKTKNRMIRRTNFIIKKGHVSKKDRGTLSAYNGIVLNSTGSRLRKNHIEPVKEMIECQDSSGYEMLTFNDSSTGT